MDWWVVQVRQRQFMFDITADGMLVNYGNSRAVDDFFLLNGELYYQGSDPEFLNCYIDSEGHLVG